MSQIYKISFENGTGKTEMFAIKPLSARFDNFKDEIFIRMPEMKNKPLKFYYEDIDGDKITIFNTNDFAIFQEQGISKVFVEVPKLVQKWPTLGAPQILPLNSMISAPPKPAPGASILKKMPSSASADDIRRYLHSGVLCDNCDIEIRGYRYKCLECADFDLCMECEPSNHSHHLLLRIANPNDAEIFYRAKLCKRFGHHRRSESLYTKPTEDRDHDKKFHHDKKAHHKRHSKFSRLANFDVQSGVASRSNENAKPAGQQNHHGKNGKKPKTSSTATPSKQQGYGQPLKTHIDTLSNMAQNFAAMVDPCATFNNETTENIANGQILAAVPNDPNVLLERVEDILKTLTSDNVNSVFEQLKALKIDTKENISIFVSIIFEKAINEPHLSTEIAELVKKLSGLKFSLPHEFKKVLLCKCQQEFQTYVAHENSFATDENRKFIEGNEPKLHCRSVSLVKFLGELYRQDMLLTRIMELCVIDLLNIPTEKKLECLCILLTTIGQKMETRTGDAWSDRKYYRDLMPHIQKIQHIANFPSIEISSRVRSMMLDVIELHKNKWIKSSESMDGVDTTKETEKTSKPQASKQSVSMVVNCSDDDIENPFKNLLNRDNKGSSSDGSQSE